ncbi:lysophospholipid acyltransferase family protein [Gracilibacillus massiliensis]|uniref:lysophospholipid acyltransferase family protein n=1 Tax=Gracilibacillus massiliensis TaxID=1564956 RepID=UPI00071C2E84|nr:lysophospholipid acyltransferase family protein [Gracilibacillus massiliensis]
MSIEKKPANWIVRLLLKAINLYLKRKTTFIVTKNETKQLKPPYLIVSNHVNNWDPLFINLFVDEPIAFVAGEPLFRHPQLKKVLQYTGAIRKTKFRNDTSTIRNLIKAKKHNRVIGLFPEGNRNWDGVTEPIIYSTAKLLKLLKTPVVAAKIKGGYLTHPRWADSDRKGTIEISYEKIWNGSELQDLSVSEIHQHLTAALSHNEHDWQAINNYIFKGTNIAHFLERLLFTCPGCKSINTMHSEGDLFRCTNCEYYAIYTEQGHFHSQDILHFKTPHEWKMWQLSFLNELSKQPSRFKKALQNMKETVTLYQSHNQEPFQKICEGSVILPNSQLDIVKSDRTAYSFSLLDMEGINIHFHHKLDFFIDDILYRIIFTNPRASAYMWLQFIQIIKEKDLLKEQSS